jgi:hypothetical protein
MVATASSSIYGFCNSEVGVWHERREGELEAKVDTAEAEGDTAKAEGDTAEVDTTEAEGELKKQKVIQ